MRAESQASDPLLRRMTLDEWASLPEDAEGEFVDGWLVEEEVPDFIHELIVGWLLEKLVPWARRQGGVAGASDAKFAVSPSRGRKPDLTVFLPENMPPAHGLVRVPPLIAVEIVSSRARDRRRDRVDKSAEYASFGVQWYWLVDPDPLRIEIHRLAADGSYSLAATISDGVHHDVAGCPDLVLDLDELAGDIARLAPGDDGDPGPR
jgi:Uma2 family endonuclease